MKEGKPYTKISSKINRIFMKDEAYNTLSYWIITGELEQNTKLNINDLSELLGISRTPVREALLRLEKDGLVLTKANSWTIVAPINLEEAYNIYSVIISLEELALRQAFPKIKKSNIKELENLNEELGKAFKKNDFFDVLQKDNHFHSKIIELSGNNEILPIIDSLKKRIQRMELYFFQNVQKKEKSYLEHKKILLALEEKNLEKSVETLKNNWKNSILLNKI